MIHEIPDLGDVKNIRMPHEYRNDPALIKSYLTGFMNAWLLALEIQQSGQSRNEYTLDNF